MKITERLKKRLQFCRWSYVVTAICYTVFLLVFWTMALPLKSEKSQKSLEEQIRDRNRYRIIESLFQVKLRDDKTGTEDTTPGVEFNFLRKRSDYLIDPSFYEKDPQFARDVLIRIFQKADTDGNEKLDSRELAEWIRKKIIQHISDALSNNKALFLKIDVHPANGVVTWNEYHSYFLNKRGFSKKYVEKHDEKRHRGLKRSLKEEIMRDRANWMEAARSNPDALTVEEFLAFSHPESSAVNQLMLVDELFDKFDRDGDELLTEDEFAVLQTEGRNDETVVVRQDENQRRVEFRKIIDLNGDGRADRRELLNYVAPQSPRHSEHEAEALLALADTDHDNTLSINEMLTHPDLFLRSKMVDTSRSFHDEF